MACKPFSRDTRWTRCAQLVEIAEPTAAHVRPWRRCVVIDVRAASVAFLDLLFSRGLDLASVGLTARVIKDDACCGLTLVFTGQLDKARALMQKAVASLTPYVESGVPVIGSSRPASRRRAATPPNSPARTLTSCSRAWSPSPSWSSRAAPAT
jgi:hypothetical protein